MARRTKEEALETREELLDAAERVFLERGVGHASLAEVADAAGVTRGAIYHHFESKADLFEAMVARAVLPFDAAFEPGGGPESDPLGAMRERARHALLHLATSPRVRTVFEIVFLRCEYTDELAPVERRHLRDRDRCLGQSGGLIERAVALGHLPPATDTRMAARLFYALISGIMRDWVQSPRTYSLKVAAPQAMDLFIAGLRAAPPLKSGH